MTYCDTSFLASLYLPGQTFEPIARPIAAGFNQSIPFPALSELELCNSLYLLASRQNMGRQVTPNILLNIARDKSNGILNSCELQYASIFARAMTLAKRWTSTHQCRSLDILHVAAALELRAKTLASFDGRQRKLAASLGLKVLPATLP